MATADFNNLIRGLADFIQEASPELDERTAIIRALETMETTGYEDAPEQYFRGTPVRRFLESRRDMWRKVHEFFELEAEAQAELDT